VIEQGVVVKFVFDPEYEDAAVVELVRSLQAIASMPHMEQKVVAQSLGRRAVYRFDQTSGLWRPWDARTERYRE
jgi:hypothetical protein